MKGKTWKLWGVLCVAVLFGLGIAPEAKAVDQDRIYEVTGEEHFIFDTETQMITGYQDLGPGENGEGTGDVSVVEEQNPETVVVVPRQIQGVEVKGLTGTFQGNSNLQKVILPDTVVSLGDDVFCGCTNLSAVCVYQTDKSYQEEQVTENQEQDWRLSYVKMDSTSEDIDGNRPGVSEEVSEGENTVISDPSMQPDNRSAGENVYFEVIDRGSCAVIPASLQSIGQRAFNSCAIASFDVMEGSEYFKDSGEGGANLQEGVGACLTSFDGKKLYRLAPGFRDQNNSLQYTIPEGIEEILPYAGQALGWQHVAVASTVKSIDSYGFYESGLLGITFTEAAQLETVGDWAFAYNDNLDISLPASVKTIGKYSFAYIANRTPDLSKTQITVLPEYTFAGCPNLHTITMPATLQTIENYAFAGNPNLNEVVFTGSTLTSIGTGAFQNCTNMHKINIPSGVTSIEPGTFSGCSNLNEVILPEGLQNIKDEAFSGCQNIHTMVIPSTVTYIAGNSFSGCNTREIDTSKNAYARSAIGGATYVPSPAPKPQMPGVGYQKTIGKLVYKVTGSGTVTLVKPTSKSIQKVTIPASVRMDGFAFRVTAISAKAFVRCQKLKSVVIGVNVRTIGKQAFQKCKKLAKITIKTKKLTKGTVGAGSFKGIAGKATVKVPKKKYKAYKKFLRKKGVGKKAKIKK